MECFEWNCLSDTPAGSCLGTPCIAGLVWISFLHGHLDSDVVVFPLAWEVLLWPHLPIE